jgi:glycerophosphoryl diester phosphodiesterase/lysophospholipase L1-like esterase
MPNDRAFKRVRRSSGARQSIQTPGADATAHEQQCQSGRRSSNRQIAAAVCALLGCSARLQAQNYNPNNFDAVVTMHEIEHPHDDLVILNSHRGNHALVDGKYRNIPENSLVAIGLAAQAGAEAIELDVKLTADSDPVPVLSHDLTIGRETSPNTPNYCPLAFDPFHQEVPGGGVNDTYNPLVSARTLDQLRSYPGYSLRDTISIINLGSTQACKNAPLGVWLPTLKEALDYMTQNKIAMVLALDIRDAATAAAALKVILNHPGDYLGRSYLATTLFKIPAKVFPSPTAYVNNFYSITPGISSIHFQPVINTGDIAADVFGSEQSINNWLYDFETDEDIHVSAVEVQIKQYGSILTSVLAYAKTNQLTQQPEAVTVFSPFADYYAPDDPNRASPLFFKTNGYCCVDLSAFWYNKPADPNYDSGRPSDTGDNRGSLLYLNVQGFNSITTDNPIEYSNQFNGVGKRKLCRIEPGGCPVNTSGAPQRIMIVGDSISAGREGDYTWRYRLWQWFQSQNIPVHFVGPYFGTQPQASAQAPQPVPVPPAKSNNDAPGPVNNNGGYALQSDGSTILFDSGHFAVWGRQVAQDKGLIAAQVQTYQPDTLLVELGFNDVGWFVSDGQGTLDSMQQFITNARSANPNLKFVIANIPQRTSLGAWRADLIQKTTYYNTHLPAAAAAWSTPTSPVVIADFDGNYGCDPTSTVCDSTSDGLHPNDLGEFRIARAFETALQSNFFPNASVSYAPPTVPTRIMGTPTNMQFDGTLQGATASWTPVYGAYGYDVEWEEQAPGSSTWSAWNLDGYGTPFSRWDKGWQFDGRPYAGYGYGIQVRANAGTGRVSGWSAVASGVATPTTCASPGSLIVSPVTGGNIIVAWYAPTGLYSDSIYAYDVWVVDQDTPTVSPTIYNVGLDRATLISGLKTGDHYAVLVEAWNAAGPSKPAISASFVAL